MLIKQNDTVRVIAGDDRGSEGKVLSIDHESGKIVVEKMNRVYKHVKASQRNPQGGRLSLEMPMAISNVKVVCPKCSKASRMGSRMNAAGAKERWCKKCGQAVNEMRPAKKSKS